MTSDKKNSKRMSIGGMSKVRSVTNKNGSRTLLLKGKGTAGSVFMPKNNKKGKVLITIKRWVSRKSM